MPDFTEWKSFENMYITITKSFFIDIMILIKFPHDIDKKCNLFYYGISIMVFINILNWFYINFQN